MFKNKINGEIINNSNEFDKILPFAKSKIMKIISKDLIKIINSGNLQKQIVYLLILELEWIN